MDILQELEWLEKKMREREMADDGYYISRQYKEDCRMLYRLKKLLRREQVGN